MGELVHRAQINGFKEENAQPCTGVEFLQGQRSRRRTWGRKCRRKRWDQAELELQEEQQLLHPLNPAGFCRSRPGQPCSTRQPAPGDTEVTPSFALR